MPGQEGLSVAAAGSGAGDDKDGTNLDNWPLFLGSVTDSPNPFETSGKERSVLCKLHFPCSVGVPTCNCVFCALFGGQSQPPNFCRLLFRDASLKCHPFPVPSIILGPMDISQQHGSLPALDVHGGFEHRRCIYT